MTVHGKVVAITGGARGIGRSIATELARQGAKVAIGDIDADGVKAAGEELGEGVLAHELDVTDKASYETFLKAVEEELGPLDVLVNNAGIMAVGPLEDEADSTWERMLQINLNGVIIGTKLAIERMLPRGRGHVINVASMAGLVPYAGAASYNASKYGVVGFTSACTLEYIDRGLDFSYVAPAFVKTELISGVKPPVMSLGPIESDVGMIEPQDVADAVVATIEKPRPDVLVPKYLGPLIRGAPLMGFNLSRRLARALGVDRGFLDQDPEARAAYNDRIAGN